MKGRASPSGKVTQFVKTVSTVMPSVNAGSFNTHDVDVLGVESGDIIGVSADSSTPFPVELLFNPPLALPDQASFVFRNVTGAPYAGGDTVLLNLLITKTAALRVP